MSSYLRVFLILLVGMVLGFGLSLGPSVWASRSSTVQIIPWQQANLFAEVYERVRRDYLEDISDARLMSSAVRGIVSELDEYSTYLDPKEYEEMRIATSGAYSGVGIELSLENGSLKVIAAIDDSPAAQGGIRSGDIILDVDGVTVDPDNLNDSVDRLRGKPGSNVRLTMSRIGVSKPLSFNLMRRKVQVHSVKSEILEPGFGYIRISQFSETTADDLTLALNKLQLSQLKGLRGLILDLRDNPGGVLEAAVDVADNFLEKGVIVTAQGRAPEARFAMQAQPGDLLNGAPMTVLVNAGSASASEIVAGALQDHRRALLVGRNTYGKGLVQSVVSLEQGGALKLTTSRYHTPSGASINQMGIKPDMVIADASGVLNPSAASKPALAQNVPSVPNSKDAEVKVALDKLKQLAADQLSASH